MLFFYSNYTKKDKAEFSALSFLIVLCYRLCCYWEPKLSSRSNPALKLEPGFVVMAGMLKLVGRPFTIKFLYSFLIKYIYPINYCKAYEICFGLISEFILATHEANIKICSFKEKKTKRVFLLCLLIVL
jgi:hypothetical protein